MLALLGDKLSYVGNNSVLLNPLKEGINIQVANMNKKRLVIFREPDADKKINSETMKELTGDGEISAESKYSNDDKIRLMATFILECNARPLFSGKMDNAVVRRLKDIPFTSTFTNDETLLNDTELENIHKADVYFKTKEFKEVYKHALFSYLVNFVKDYEATHGVPVYEKITDCKEVLDRTKDFIESCDEVYGFVKENYERGDATDFVKMVDMYADFKNKVMVDFTKEQKRALTKKKFVSDIKTNMYLRRFYKDRKKIEGTEHRSILCGWREKNIDDGIAEDFE